MQDIIFIHLKETETETEQKNNYFTVFLVKKINICVLTHFCILMIQYGITLLFRGNNLIL